MQPSIPKTATALICLCLAANAAAAITWTPWEDRLKEACTVWKVPPQKTAYRSPKVHLTPTLMVSGYLDPATPPVHAEAAAKTLPKARQVVVRNGSHSFAGMKGASTW
jgi:pimeloyl-ACP methyl ester carboxylesterase